MIGDTGVGKSALMDGIDSKEQMHLKTIDMNGQQFALNVEDDPKDGLLSESGIFMLCFAVNNRESWFNEEK